MNKYSEQEIIEIMHNEFGTNYNVVGSREVAFATGTRFVYSLELIIESYDQCDKKVVTYSYETGKRLYQCNVLQFN